MSTFTDLCDHARTTLVTLSNCLLALHGETGDLGAEARRIWLLSKFPLSDYADLERALTLVGDVVGFVNNWSDCARPERERNKTRADRYAEAVRTVAEHAKTVTLDQEHFQRVRTALEIEAERLQKIERSASDQREEDFEEKLLAPAQKAAAEALAALCTIVDHLRALPSNA